MCAEGPWFAPGYGRGDGLKLYCYIRPSQTFTDAQLRASCWAVSPPPCMATAPPTIAGLSRGWCGLHNASLGANYLPSRTPTAPTVTGRPKRPSRTIITRATAFSPHYHPEGKVSTGASKLGNQTVKQPSLTQRLLPTYRLEIIGLFNKWITSH